MFKTTDEQLNAIELEERKTKEKIALQKDLDGITRILEEASISSDDIAQAGCESELDHNDLHDADNNNVETKIDNEAHDVASGIGSAVAVIAASAWFFLRKKLPEKFNERLLSLKFKLNPWYRRFKTANAFGSSVGQLIAETIPLPHHIPLLGSLGRRILSGILSPVIGVVIGVVAATVLPDNPEKFAKYFKLGTDGWTKYAKSGLVFGGQVGSVIGGVIGLCLGGPPGMLLGMLIGNAAGSVLGFAVGAISVPLINKISSKFNKEGKGILSSLSNFRTNYVRAGVACGAGLGAAIGAVLGAFCFGIGAIPGAALGSAIGSVLGGVVAGVAGTFISKKVDPHNYSANSWDYGARTGTMLGNNYSTGSIFKALLSPTVSTIVTGVTTFVGGIAAAAREMYHSYKAKQKDTDQYLPWSQRTASGMIVGWAIGGLIGFFTGSDTGATLGAGIGGTAAGAAAMAADLSVWQRVSNTCSNIWQRCKMVFKRKDNPVTADTLVTTPEAQPAPSLTSSPQMSKDQGLPEVAATPVLPQTSTPQMLNSLRKSSEPIDIPQKMPSSHCNTPSPASYQAIFAVSTSPLADSSIHPHSAPVVQPKLPTALPQPSF